MTRGGPVEGGPSSPWEDFESRDRGDEPQELPRDTEGPISRRDFPQGTTDENEVTSRERLWGAEVVGP